MFYNAAQMMGRLQHPNILPVYDAGEEDGKYYVVSEPIHGARTLAAYCRPDYLLRVDEVVEIIFKNDRIDKQQQFDLLRQLSFFHEFSHSEIWEVLRAGE